MNKILVLGLMILFLAACSTNPTSTQNPIEDIAIEESLPEAPELNAESYGQWVRCPTSYGWCLLVKYGDGFGSGYANDYEKLWVKWVQNRLNALGFNAGTADGLFGNGTKNAVINFQRNRCLGADGIVGSQSYTALIQNSSNCSSTPRAHA